MLLKSFIALLCLPILTRAELDKWMPRELGRFPLAHAGFIEVYETDAGDKDMIITTFNPALPYFHDSVYTLRNPGQFLDSVSSWDDSLVQLGGGATAYWPNYPVQVPENLFGWEGVLQTSGFLVPGKKHGRLELYDLSSGTPRGPINIQDKAGDSKDWSYHWVIWKDIDNDGLLDIFTARFRVPTFGDPISELIWMKNPGGEPPAAGQNWEWHHYVQVTGGPDVYFEETVMEICDPDCIEASVIVTGELWTERIMLYYVPNEPGAWALPTNIKSIVVDANPGQPFEARFADLNNDGVMEILASGYDTEAEVGNLWVYQQQEGEWVRSAIASGFIANSYLFGGSMTPGKSRLFWPSEEYKDTLTETGAVPKPWIALSGDDDGVHYVLFPLSEDPSNMEYEMQVMMDTEQTTAGTMAVVDLDGDGYTEIISAGYTAGQVYVFTFAP